ncbi:MAG: hypothetical protein IJ146_04145 [Kiritimatiellae bacterium]|nr:hypothetical protein [Kiritimatiellia bacterium]
METIYSIGGIAAVFNALVSGILLGWWMREWSKRKETVAPSFGRLPDVIVIDLGGGLRGAGRAPTVPEGDEPPAGLDGKTDDGDKAGDATDDEDAGVHASNANTSTEATQA